MSFARHWCLALVCSCTLLPLGLQHLGLKHLPCSLHAQFIIEGDFASELQLGRESQPGELGNCLSQRHSTAATRDCELHVIQCA